MAEEKVILETEVKLGNSTNSVKSLKAELRQVTNELANLDAGSAEFVKMAQRAGELRDRIDDTKNAINAFNPEKKFQALADTMGIAVNGFTAIQGGMALFGAENKNLQEVMAKTQGAIALATGLNGLMGMKDTFVNLGGQVKNMIPILRSFSSAMIGALTGGIAIAITLIIAYWKELKELVTGTTEAVILSNEQITESTKKGHDEFKKAANERTAILEREAKLKYDGQRLDEELAKIDRQRKIDEAVASGKLASEKKLIEEEYNKAIIDIRDKYAKIEADKLKAKKEKEEKEEKKKADDKKKKDKKDLDDIGDAIIKDLEKQQARKEEYDQQALDSRIEFARQTLENQEDQAKAEKEIADYTAKAKIESYQLGSQALMLAADLAGKNTAEGKILASAATLINTYLAAQSAYASQMAILTPDAPIRAAIAAGIAVASGLANVAAINSVQVPGGGGGASGGGGSMPSMPAAPAMRPTGFSTGQPSQTPPKVEPQKVYVVESDITNSQNKVARIQSKATIQ